MVWILCGALSSASLAADDEATTPKAVTSPPETTTPKVPSAAHEDTAAKGATTPQVEIIGHYQTGIETSDAASEGSVTYKLIEDRPIMRPGEILEFVPGMIITQHSGDGKANQYFLRGYNLDHGTDFASYVAGMPVNLPTNAHGQGCGSQLRDPEAGLAHRFQEKARTMRRRATSVGAAHIRYFDQLPSGFAR
jgi:hypothetical protein